MSTSSDHTYLVAYAHLHGFGNLDITVAGPITTVEHIRTVERHLINQGIAQPAVISFTLLRGPRTAND